MFHLYTDKSLIPSNMVLIKDIEAFFPRIALNEGFACNIISDIDSGTYNRDNKTFIDRFGITMHLKDLSTTSKLLLALYEGNLSIVFDITEIGSNGWLHLTNCNGYAYTRNYWLDLCNDGTNVEYNGKVMLAGEANYEMSIIEDML